MKMCKEIPEREKRKRAAVLNREIKGGRVEKGHLSEDRGCLRDASPFQPPGRGN